MTLLDVHCFTNVCFFSVSSNSSWTSLLYPYGFAAGDRNDGFGSCDSTSVEVNVMPGFPVFNQVQTEVHVSIRPMSVSFKHEKDAKLILAKIHALSQISWE